MNPKQGAFKGRPSGAQLEKLKAVKQRYTLKYNDKLNPSEGKLYDLESRYEYQHMNVKS